MTLRVVSGDAPVSAEQDPGKANVETIYDVNATMVPECLRLLAEAVEEGSHGDKTKVRVAVVLVNEVSEVSVWGLGRDTDIMQTAGILHAGASAVLSTNIKLV